MLAKVHKFAWFSAFYRISAQSFLVTWFAKSQRREVASRPGALLSKPRNAPLITLGL
jgi:hypothetical protein